MQVSVVTAVYNGADHLARAIASLQAQTCPDWELIVSDDGSSDGTVALVEHIAADDSRIRLLRAEQNGGPSAARNRAFAAARGDWVAVLDADDAFRPTRLANLLDAAKRTGAALIADNLSLFDGELRVESGRALDGEEGDELTLDAVAILRAERPWPGPRLGFLKPMIRTSLIRDYGLAYPETLRHSEDLVLLFDAVLAAGSATLLLKPGYIYTRPVPKLRPRSRTVQSSFVTEQRALAGQLLLQRYRSHPDSRVRRAVDDYAAWTRDIALGYVAVSELRARRPAAVAAVLRAGPRALFRFLVTVPRVKRLLIGLRLAKGSIG